MLLNLGTWNFFPAFDRTARTPRDSQGTRPSRSFPPVKLEETSRTVRTRGATNSQF
jgi:hypothetical protein